MGGKSGTFVGWRGRGARLTTEREGGRGNDTKKHATVETANDNLGKKGGREEKKHHRNTTAHARKTVCFEVTIPSLSACKMRQHTHTHRRKREKKERVTDSFVSRGSSGMEGNCSLVPSKRRNYLIIIRVIWHSFPVSCVAGSPSQFVHISNPPLILQGLIA